MKNKFLSVRLVLLVLCVSVCACIAFVGPSVAAIQDAANADASGAYDWSNADDSPGAGISGPAPSRSEPWYLSWYVFIAFAAAMLLAERLVRGRFPPTKDLIGSVVPACITFGPLFMTRIAGSASPEVGDELVFIGVTMLAVGLGIMFTRIEAQRREIAKLLSERQVAE